ncbi:hypothetical protein P872_25045 [Rhodonellum psychrophilum GCM71 = DSM 17998]|uniref:Uncharacterized protein n=2 Tax=Rhodonellum TaxID=336827 RepID=U5C8B8_9BACT|nr:MULTISPECIES: hypothetical protein [Rhodonellum]ERM84427.1 hypothetical protein P872_25045 [Rhodonellum psychrophilum GCM71 = DSM 17998]SDY99858.1 hypothetical protein SAMN05444412_104242 [Rhodonellum ikkaensis]
MTECKPKKNTYFSLSIVLAIILSGLVFLLHEFATERSYGLIFYLFSSSLLTLLALILLVKMMAGYKFISFGQGKIITRLPLRRQTKSYHLNQVLAWEEERMLANKRDFRQLTIIFDDKTAFSVSNHEHSSYPELFQYLNKKIPKKKVLEKTKD